MKKHSIRCISFFLVCVIFFVLLTACDNRKEDTTSKNATKETNQESTKPITTSTTSSTITEETTKESTKPKATSATSKTVADYIETGYSDSVTFTTSYSEETYSYNVPRVKGINSEYAKEINNELNELIDEFKQTLEYYRNNDTDYGYGGQKYQGENLIALNNDILSIVIPISYDGGSRWYHVYNINVETGEKVSNLEILKTKNVSEEKYISKLKELSKAFFLEKYPFERFSAYKTKELYDEKLNETISSVHCNLSRPLFLGENNTINVVASYLSLAGPQGNYEIFDTGL